MQATHHESNWDLTPVLNLLQSISPPTDHNTTHNSPYGKQGLAAALSGSKDGAPDASDKEDDQGVQLGNFNKLWKFLGVKPPSTSFTPTFEASTASKNADAYASDGSLYYPPSSKTVKWRDEEDGYDLADTQPDSPPSPDLKGLTKNQRKNRNRRLRKAGQPVPQASKQVPLNSETEEEVPTTPSRSPKLKKKTKSKASTPKQENKSATDVSADEAPLATPAATPKAASDRPAAAPAPAPTSTTPAQQQASMPGQPSPATLKWLGGARSLMPLPAAALHTPPPLLTPKQQVAEKTAKQTPITDTIAAAVDKFPSRPPQPNRSQSFQTPQKPAASAYLQSLHNSQPRKSMAPTAALYQSGNTPSSAPPKAQQDAFIQPPAQTANLSNYPVITSKPHPPSHPRGRHRILPQFPDAEDRNWTLLMKLLQQFPSDRKHLLSPLQLSINRVQQNGIHVFVDASNILIGFQDHLKRARGIPLEARIEPRVYPDFHALALLLERRRPIAKRVLAGSTPEVAAFEQARQVGYETCILDKVYKAKELTAKQKRMAARRASASNGGNSGYESGDASDGYMTQDAGQPHAKQPKWVEQAVDEILHLKILESIVDTPIQQSGIDSNAIGNAPVEPQRPTMVLATGDAAEAEYSSGFLKMVKRALKAGWNVEVMAWGASVSMDYRKLASRAHWGDQFKIVELDGFAELLFAEAE